MISYHVSILPHDEAKSRGYLWESVEDDEIDIIEGVNINNELHSVIIDPAVLDYQSMERLDWILDKEFSNKTRVIQVVKVILSKR